MKRLVLPARLNIAGYRLDTGSTGFWLAFGLTLAAELALVQRRFLIFGGNVPKYSDLDRPAELAAFLAALVPAHLLLILSAWLAFRAFYGKKRNGPACAFAFLYWTLAATAFSLAVKLKLFSYFGDSMDAQIAAALAGGRLVDGFAYVGEEAVPFAAAAVCALLLFLLIRRAAAFEPASPTVRRWRRLFWLPLVLVPPLLFVAAAVPDSRAALERFNAPWIFYRLLETATDADRDGYSLFSSPRDGAPFDSARHPFALDVPNDGVDQDGLGGDFRFDAAAAAPEGPAAFPAGRKNIVLIVLESTRGDAVRKRWEGRAVAPHLGALAAHGSASAEAYSHFGLTSESLKTIFSGTAAPQPGGPSLFRDLRRAGYRVGVFSAQAEDFAGIAAAVAMRENSDVFVDAKTLAGRVGDEVGPRAEGRRPLGEDVRLRADERRLLVEMDRHFGSQRQWDRPIFLYFNFQSPHFPYSHPDMPNLLPGSRVPRSEIKRANRRGVERTYWNAVAYADWHVGQIVARLRRLGVYDSSVIAVVGDHGEELFEQGHIGHGYALNEVQTRVPFVLSVPNIELPRPVGLAQLRRILLRAAGANLAPPSAAPVFQYVGSLDRPSLIGLVGTGGRRATFELRTGRIFTGEADRGFRYSDLPGSSRLRLLADRVVAAWERERWQAHRASQRNARPSA